MCKCAKISSFEVKSMLNWLLEYFAHLAFSKLTNKIHQRQHEKTVISYPHLVHFVWIVMSWFTGSRLVCWYYLCVQAKIFYMVSLRLIKSLLYVNIIIINYQRLKTKSDYIGSKITRWINNYVCLDNFEYFSMTSMHYYMG